MGAATINDSDGDYVSGVRNGTYERTSSGYRSIKYPDMQHPPLNVDGTKNPDGQTAMEDFADMFMNYVQGTFASGPAGDARNNWMNDNLTPLLARRYP